MASGRYDVAQICLNGHIITTTATTKPERTQKYCDDCGAEAINGCPSCQAPIRGMYYGDVVYGPRKAPGYCYECGRPYPWTEAHLRAAAELIDLSDVMDEQREALKKDLPDLTVDTPRTKVAVARMRQFLDRAGGHIASAMKDLLVEIASETAKKTLFG